VAKIVGIITTDLGSVSGGSPIFYTKNREDMQKIAHLLEKLMDCAAHEVHKDLFIVIDRH
jgi:hypothetical protein